MENLPAKMRLTAQKISRSGFECDTRTRTLHSKKKNEKERHLHDVYSRRWWNSAGLSFCHWNDDIAWRRRRLLDAGARTTDGVEYLTTLRTICSGGDDSR